jgi:hypothetical protein
MWRPRRHGPRYAGRCVLNLRQQRDKSKFELTMELVTEVRSITEWHRSMTHENLNQSGRVVNLEKFVIGTEVYFYKPPTVQDVKQKGMKAKHLDHYVGPAKITKKNGDRSFQISYKHPDGERWEEAVVSERSMNAKLILKKEIKVFSFRISIQALQFYSQHAWEKKQEC